jgi:hypothetical protein
MHDHALVPANPMAGASRPALALAPSSPGVYPHGGGRPRQANPPAMWASMHAGMRATRVPRAQRSSQAANCREIAAAGHHPEARGCDPHLPDLADSDMETRGCGNMPAATRSWRQRPGGALTISFAPSAEALCDALVVNGRRLPAITRPRPPRAGL